MKSRNDVYEQRAGVCATLPHLALTFCRCMNSRRAIARLSRRHRVPAIPRRRTFPVVPVISPASGTRSTRATITPAHRRILMGTGRDAADVALTTSFGGWIW